MNKEIIDKIIEYLIEKFNPEIIYLWGSRSKNTNHINSDWDLYLVWNFQINNEQFSEYIFWEHLDITLFSKQVIQNNNVLKIFYGPLPNLKLLFDKTNWLWNDILIETQRVYLLWPQNITLEEIDKEIKYLKRLLSKIMAYKENSEIVFYHIAHYYFKIIPFWFTINYKWSLPVQYGLPIIKEEDDIFYLELKNIVDWKNINEKINSCNNVLNYFINKQKKIENKKCNWF